MFIEIKNLTEVERDLSGRELLTKTKTIYLISGQSPNEKILHPKTQELYKKLYNLQEEKTSTAGYPVTLFELINNSNFKKLF